MKNPIFLTFIARWRCWRGDDARKREENENYQRWTKLIHFLSRRKRKRKFKKKSDAFSMSEVSTFAREFKWNCVVLIRLDLFLIFPKLMWVVSCGALEILDWDHLSTTWNMKEIRNFLKFPKLEILLQIYTTTSCGSRGRWKTMKITLLWTSIFIFHLLLTWTM